jgi:peroxiredoxin
LVSEANCKEEQPNFGTLSTRKSVVIGATLLAGVGWAALTVQLALTVREWRPMVRLASESKILPQVGTFVPVHLATTIGGSSIRLGEAAEGRSQVFMGIQAACPLCREMMPQLRAMADSIAASGNHDVVWLSLSPLDSTAAYVSEHGIRQPVVLLEDERTSVSFGIRGVPTIIVIDREGRIRYRHAGRFRSLVAADSVRQMALASTEVWRRNRASAPASVSLVAPK